MIYTLRAVGMKCITHVETESEVKRTILNVVVMNMQLQKCHTNLHVN